MNLPDDPNEDETPQSDEAADRWDVSAEDETVDGDVDHEPEPLTEDTEPVIDDSAEDTEPVIDDGADEPSPPDDSDPFDDTEPQIGAASTPPPPPQQPYAPVAGRLERDPYATFGGVASGIAHRYGWDVALTRLAVFALFIVSGGVAIPVYLLAWLIIPRAAYWPPQGRTRMRRLSPRDIGMGLLVTGVLVALAIGGGDAGAVLVPLALVGGGIWLLIQNPRPEPAIAGAMMAAPDVVAAPPVPPAAPPLATPLPLQPAPKRSRRRRVAMVGLVVAAVLALIAMIAIPLILFFAISGANIEVNPDKRVVVRPASVVDIPPVTTLESGTIVLDLRDLEPSMFADRDDAVQVVVDVDLGQIEVILPDDLRVDIDASTDLGQVTVFGSEEGGIGPDKEVDVADAHLDLVLDTGVGEVDVRRG